MKEVTKWDNNPREMWVWDYAVEHKIKAEVVYLGDASSIVFPVITLGKSEITDAQCFKVFKHCAEIEEPKTRRMTHKELSRWLRENPTREFVYSKDGELIFCYHTYPEDEASKEVPDSILIRENDGEWREPLVEVKEC